jgi:hypothetical protein
MTPLERNKSILRKYIPEQFVDTIAEWIYKYDFKLRIKKSRSSKTGDYTPPHNGKNHTITINSDLNKYEFFITLIHEIAHLITYEKYKNKVSPHGKEWKAEYSKLLSHFLQMHNSFPNGEGKGGAFFPEDISLALHRHILHPYATSCSDLTLSRVLRRYDAPSEYLSLEKIPAGSLFRIAPSKTKHNPDVFIKGERKRTRFRCIHIRTKKEYLIHALCKVVVTQP